MQGYYIYKDEIEIRIEKTNKTPPPKKGEKKPPPPAFLGLMVIHLHIQ